MGNITLALLGLKIAGNFCIWECFTSLGQKNIRTFHREPGFAFNCSG